jgi:hypothetical protein
LSFACHSSVHGEKVLFDFESDAELDRFHWKCHTLFSLSGEHVTRGGNSLRLELFPSDFPGLSPMLEENDWRGFKQLAFDVFNSEAEEIQISVRIDDKVIFPGYEDRYNGQYALRPGANTVAVPLDELVTSGTGRKLNLKTIHRFLVFVERPEKRIVLYLDYLRLSSAQWSKVAGTHSGHA